MDRRALALLSFGHLATDASQGAVPALLPFLIHPHGLSVGQGALLVLAATVASSVLQPLFGVMSDRRSMPWLLTSGPLLGVSGIAAVSFTTTFAQKFAVIALSGIGVAAFHPEASRYASYISASRPATGMSFFSVGGNIGFALGPALVAALVVPFGLDGLLGFPVLGLLATLALSIGMSRLRRFRPVRRPRERDGAVDQWGPFSRLALAVVLRSGVYFGLLTFVPLWFTRHLGTSRAAADVALTVMLASGALGTLIGGRLGDRLGPRRVFTGSMALVPFLIGGFWAAGSPVVAGLMVALAGAVTIATFSTTVVIGQQLMPGHLGIASGVMLGLSIGSGGLIAAVLGVVADAQGLSTVIAIVALLPLGALALAATMPRNVAAVTPVPRAAPVSAR